MSAPTDPNAPLRAGVVTIGVQLLRFGINLGATMLLARLLTPEDFGVHAMALTAFGLLVLFRDGGVEPALLHRSHLTPDELASVASLNALYGIALAGLCAVVAPALAWFYGEPRLEAAVLLLCVCFLGYGLNVQPAVLLLRGGQYATHAWIELGSLTAGMAAALALAAQGAGYWALFLMEVTFAFSLLIGNWRAARWRPRFSRRLRDAASFIRFGRDVSISRIIGHLARNIDHVLIGMHFGPAALALYAKAFRLVNLPQEGINWPLTRVAVPTLSRLREDPVAFVAAFRRFNLMSVALGLPWAAFFIIAAEGVVRVIYGEQWMDSASLLRLLGAVGLLNTFLLATSWIYISTGTVQRQVRWEAVNLSVLTAALFLGLRWGPAGIAVAVSSSYALLRIPALSYCFRHTCVRLADIGAILWRPGFAVAMATAAVAGAGAIVSPPSSIPAKLAFDGAVFFSAYVIGWTIVPGWLTFLRRELGEPSDALDHGIQNVKK